MVSYIPIHQRIKILLESLKIDQKEFASNVGITPQAISKTIRGESKPSFDLLESIITAYPSVNALWLLTGKGEIWINEISERKENKKEILSADFLIRQLESVTKDKEHYRELWEEEKRKNVITKNLTEDISSVETGKENK